MKLTIMWMPIGVHAPTPSTFEPVDFYVDDKFLILYFTPKRKDYIKLSEIQRFSAVGEEIADEIEDRLEEIRRQDRD